MKAKEVMKEVKMKVRIRWINSFLNVKESVCQSKAEAKLKVTNVPAAEEQLVTTHTVVGSQKSM